MAKTQAKQFVVCIDNEGYAVSLEKRKIYVALRDAAADKHNMLRIVDESGEDYLYPKTFFRPIALPQVLKRVVRAAEQVEWVSRRRNPPLLLQATSSVGIFLIFSPSSCCA